MAQFCLIPAQVDAFKQAIFDGRINPAELSDMTSEKRNKFLAEIVGEENATQVNSLFESKLLLKDQQAGFIRWAQKVTGITPEAKRDLISKIEKLDKVLSTSETDQFLKDLASTKLGIDVNREEAKRILELSNKAQALKEKGGKEYGHAVLDLEDYMDEISPAEKENPLTTVGGGIKALQATADLSAPFRQGRDYFGTKEWVGAFGRMFKYAADRKAYRDLNASIVSDPLFDLASKSKLAFSSLGDNVLKREEQFVSKWAKKMPIIANSERAYSGFLTDLRWNRFKNTVTNLEKAGITVDKQMGLDLAGVINSGTGRGDIGPALEQFRGLSEAIWSPKMVKSRLDLLLNIKSYTTYSKPARVEQWKRLFRMSATTVSILGMAKMAGAEVETDPRSSDFGKIKIGNKRFDVTGGYAGYIRLLAQGVLRSTKTTKGDIIPLNTGDYGSKTWGDLIKQFFTGKESPLLSTANDLFGGKDFDGNNLRLPGATQRYLYTKIMPLITQDVYEAYKDDGIKGAIETWVPALFGVSVQDYGSTDTETEEIVTDNSNVGMTTKILGYPKPQPKAELKPLLKKMNDESVNLNLPGSNTKITPPGTSQGREMTSKELKEYRDLYKVNIRTILESRKDQLVNMPSVPFSKQMDKIKEQATEKSKNELIRKMVR